MNKKTGDDDGDDENERKAGYEKFEETVKLCNLLILVGFSDLFFLKEGNFWMDVLCRVSMDIHYL